jgi:hypothetical protein
MSHITYNRANTNGGCYVGSTLYSWVSTGFSVIVLVYCLLLDVWCRLAEPIACAPGLRQPRPGKRWPINRAIHDRGCLLEFPL